GIFAVGSGWRRDSGGFSVMLRPLGCPRRRERSEDLEDRPPLPDDSVAARSACAWPKGRSTWGVPRPGAIEGIGPPRLLAVAVVLGCVLVAPRPVRGQLNAPELPSPSTGPTPSLPPALADPTATAP